MLESLFGVFEEAGHLSGCSQTSSFLLLLLLKTTWRVGFFFFCLLSQGNKVKWQLRICIWVYLFCCLFSSTLKSWAICIKFDSGWRSQRHSVLNSFAKTDVWIGQTYSPPSKSPQNKVIPHTLKFIRSTQDRNYGALVAHLLKASILCFGEGEKAKRCSIH